MSHSVAKQKPAKLHDDEFSLLVNDLVMLERIESDQVCTQCGSWKSEHDYSVCKAPNWITPSDD